MNFSNSAGVKNGFTSKILRIPDNPRIKKKISRKKRKFPIEKDIKFLKKSCKKKVFKNKFSCKIRIKS